MRDVWYWVMVGAAALVLWPGAGLTQAAEQQPCKVGSDWVGEFVDGFPLTQETLSDLVAEHMDEKALVLFQAVGAKPLIAKVQGLLDVVKDQQMAQRR